MDQSLKPLDVAYSGALGAERQRVLRNTYALLALSMIPTVLGAWLGVAMNFSLFAGNPMIGFVAFMAIAFGFFYGIEKFKHSGVGVLLLLGFTFFMGLMLSRLIGHVLGFSNGAELVFTAFGGTAGVFLVMASLASVIKRDLSGMGKFLFVGLIMLVIGSLINVFVGSTAGMIVLSMISIGIFSAYMLYDIKRIIDGGETNYISATLALYLDIFNVFQSLLIILGVTSGDGD